MQLATTLVVPPCCVAAFLRGAQPFLRENTEAFVLAEELALRLENIPVGDVTPEEREQWRKLNQR